MMLYFEICFGFMLGGAVLRQPMFATALVGALLIVGGTAFHGVMRQRGRQRGAAVSEAQLQGTSSK